MEFASHHMKLHTPDERGATKFQLLSRFSENTGKWHPDLVAPDIDPSLVYLWNWFAELCGGRSWAGSGPGPLSYLEIEAWARLTKRAITSFEVQCIKALDKIYLTHHLGAAANKSKGRP